MPRISSSSSREAGCAVRAPITRLRAEPPKDFSWVLERLKGVSAGGAYPG